MTQPYVTDADLASSLGKSREWVHAQCRSGWPHMRVGKSYRFTAEQVAAIEAMLTATRDVAPVISENPWGAKGRSA